ncbi:MAG: alpha/beta hydrolase [Leptospirales bacterium]|jgi:pimeloyl-ACP methyl ester carboxylesterase
MIESSSSHRIQNARVFARLRGVGEPVLCLHGNPDSSLLWSRLWDELDAAGALDHVQCVAPDLPGFGQSEVPPGFRFDKQGQADFLRDFLTTLKIKKPVTLVVHDFGGIYGLAFAAAYPELIKRVLITNTLFFPDYRWHFFARIWRTPLLGEIAMRAMIRPIFEAILLLGSKKLKRATIHEVYRHYTLAVRLMILKLYRACDPPDFADWERRYLELAARVPVRVLWGARDPFIEEEFAHRFGTEDVRILQDCGHWVPLEEPGLLAEELRDFMGLAKTN